MTNPIKQFIYTTSHYSISAGVAKIATTMSNILGDRLHWYPNFPYRWVANTIQNNLYTKYNDFLHSWLAAHPVEESTPFDPNRRIPAWGCWLQPANTIPSFLRKIIDTQYSALSENYEYHLVSYDNIDEFIDLPGFIMDKVHKGIISPVHFTDIIRLSLLEQYGGLWLDATVLPVKKIPRTLCCTPFYTIKNPIFNFNSAEKYPEVNNWEGYFIGGEPHSSLWQWTRDFLFEYWKNNEMLIHYLMINQAALMGIKHIPYIAAEYKKLPSTNSSCELVGPALREHRFATLDDYTHDGTYVFKLSRHDNYNKNDLKKLFSEIHIQ